MVIAHSQYYLLENQVWKEYTITVSAPEKADTEYNYYCNVNVNGEVRLIHGIDELQALLLSVHHIRNKLKELERNGIDLYVTKDVKHKLDIGFAFLCDISKYK